jgi:hypothetical protein
VVADPLVEQVQPVVEPQEEQPNGDPVPLLGEEHIGAINPIRQWYNRHIVDRVSVGTYRVYNYLQTSFVGAGISSVSSGMGYL